MPPVCRGRGSLLTKTQERRSFSKESAFEAAMSKDLRSSRNPAQKSHGEELELAVVVVDACAPDGKVALALPGQETEGNESQLSCGA